ncbi:serine/threonine-protein kinase [Nocardia macrotermitis]|uniref:non-specific serine/threonine protein kinase n=1 Tax=Nocardia macrotermitis TaxID=2585198 RepID=A0A7K0CXA6_9NOCA|nr:serine/threonine-protein kinase [Nocardia macrotermitis]MQY17284.1 Serine/threonine-protein kinase PknD [Nocardia macrotermitis]
MTSDRLIAGRYRLGDPIGSGAMGVVWRASDVRLRRTVAVKQLLLAPGLTRSQALEAKMRAMREGRIAARLHHQNAVTVFDVAEEDGQPWLVMEFVDAPSLATLMREKGNLDPEEVARIGARVAAALAAAHDAGIVHRDVKPANILVADNGAVKITDFGISRAVGDVTVTSTGFLAGTPAYLAPEVARGENPESPSDVFALGSTLYAAVEGQPPFGEGDNPLAVLHSVVRAEVPAPQRAGTLGPVLMRLLAAEPGDRPTMVEAQQELEAVAEGRAPVLPPTATKILPKSSGPVDAAAATTVLAGGAAAGNAADPTLHIGAGGPSGTTSAAPPVGKPKPTGPLADRRVLVVAAAGVVVVLVVVVLIVTTLRGGGNDHTVVAASTTQSSSAVAVPPAARTSGTSAESTTAASTTTTATSSTTTTTTSATTTSAAPADAAGFMSSYYGMLPGNAAAAWPLLSAGYQSASGGYDSYLQFWGEFSSVTVSGVTENGNTATGTITYHYKNGQVTSEQRWCRVGSVNGQTVILDSQAG